METPDLNPTDDLKARIERLDQLIASREDGFRGLGVRLALGLAQELKEGVALGSTTGDMVAGWVTKFGADTVEEAVSHAGVLLKDPARMTDEFRKRLEPPQPGAVKSEVPEEPDLDEADA
ncbi:MAG: hypothetical protein AAB214_17440 [Fibrobacterota bacterium]